MGFKVVVGGCFPLEVVTIMRNRASVQICFTVFKIITPLSSSLIKRIAILQSHPMPRRVSTNYIIAKLLCQTSGLDA